MQAIARGFCRLMFVSCQSAGGNVDALLCLFVGCLYNFFCVNLVLVDVVPFVWALEVWIGGRVLPLDSGVMDVCVHCFHW